MTQAFFPRSFARTYPQAVRGEGCYIFTAEGKRYLDAAGQAAVVSIGHGVAEVARAMASQAEQLAFAHTSQFQTDLAEGLATRLLSLAPPALRRARVWFTSGGSEAVETAIKLARQYWLERGEASRVRVVSRWQSYHGSTLGALAVSGNVARRAPYLSLLPEWGHIAPCYCYRCPLALAYPACDLACADELEKFLQGVGGETVAAFIFEPVVGATLGAVVPPAGYLQRVAEICRRHGILLIADEVMTGLGRTGKNFGVEHWGIEPDMIVFGKGVASGYAPLGGVIVAPRLIEAIARGSGAFQHGFTYQAHPVALAAGLAVLDYVAAYKLFERVAPAGEEFRMALESLRGHACVGDIRGCGLLVGVEFVKDRATREPFPREAGLGERIRQAALDEGITTYPMQGCADGSCGDHILLAPPFIISSIQIREVARALTAAVDRVTRAA